jgi:predicted transcriptional regulator
MELSDEERGHLVSLVEANIHATVINTILPELSEGDKKVFLKNLVADNHDQTWSHLLSKVQDAEAKINRSLRELKKELLKDIEEAKKS